MGRFAVPLDPALYDYLVAHGSPPDEVMRDLIAETREVLPEVSGMQIAPDQSAFMQLLTRIIGVHRAVEVGTFTGMSSLSIARGMPPEGRLICLDVSEEFTTIARRYWERAGVSDRIELRLGDASASLRALPADPVLDLAFIDADKESYLTYWEELLPRMRTGGVVLVDNTLWSGRVADPDDTEETTRVIRRFNDHVAADDRVDVVVLPLGDGVTLARRR